MPAPTNEQPDVSISTKEKLSFNLFSSEPDRYQTTLTYIVYRTIEINGSITLNQLKWLLHNELLIDEKHIDSIVASLTSRVLFNTISRWRDTRNNTMHLRFRAPNVEFAQWLEKAVGKFPELLTFTPSVYKKPVKENETGGE